MNGAVKGSSLVFVFCHSFSQRINSNPGETSTQTRTYESLHVMLFRVQTTLTQANACFFPLQIFIFIFSHRPFCSHGNLQGSQPAVGHPNTARATPQTAEQSRQLQPAQTLNEPAVTRIRSCHEEDPRRAAAFSFVTLQPFATVNVCSTTLQEDHP